MGNEKIRHGDEGIRRQGGKEIKEWGERVTLSHCYGYGRF
jgi:hypothetical protein